MPQTPPVLDLEDLRHTIAEVIDIDVNEVTDTADFKEDLDVDSLLAMEILVTLERKYQVKVNEANLQDVRSLKSVFDLLTEKAVAA
ncbi:acyl carrier protein [Streptomyces sp. NPDC001415]